MNCLISHNHGILVNLNLHLCLRLCVFDCVRHQIIRNIAKHLRIRLQLHISINCDLQLIFVDQVLILRSLLLEYLPNGNRGFFTFIRLLLLQITDHIRNHRVHI